MGRKNKTRRAVKKGGQKRNQTNYNPTYVTQTAGSGNPFSYNSLFSQTGGQASAPAPASACALAANLPNLDQTSLIQSLQTYGDTVTAMTAAAASAVQAASNAQAAVTSQSNAASTYQTLVQSLQNAFMGTGTTKGLYKSITGSSFVPTPGPAPA